MKEVVQTQKVIKNLSEELKGKIKAPEWAPFVKTGHGKQRPPVDPDWFYTRSASVMLKIQKLGPIGVNKLSLKYGNRKNRGVRPEKFAPGSRNVLRKVLQQLEGQKLIQKAEIGEKKKKILTNEGNKMIINAARKGDKK